jgi:signal transduction histidine kinase
LLNAAGAFEEVSSGTITISCSSDEDNVIITIADTGCGIRPEDLARAFDPFFTTRAPGQGTGMGLAVCHGIVTRHGGTLRLASTPGQGTRVTVRLPAVATIGMAA